MVTAKIYDPSLAGNPVNPDGKWSDAFKELLKLAGFIDGKTALSMQVQADIQIVGKNPEGALSSQGQTRTAQGGDAAVGES